ncbi:MAG: electron transport complex subunit RsxC [Gammaproteobacteria bacterium]|nr:MAG: electron transport complex subunit RsxC [Gammaproteobacteria bacterium]
MLPLVGYGWCPIECLVTPGQRVNIGDSLGKGLPATVSGTVQTIESRPMAHPGESEAPCVILEPDAAASKTIQARHLKAFPEQPELTIERLAAAGVRGLGGGGFPAADKLTGRIHTLVINAVECEPCISCDNALLIDEADAVLAGVADLVHLSGANRCILAIEDNMPLALEHLQAAIDTGTAAIEIEIEIEIALVPAIYPAGAERPLLQALLGLNLADRERPVAHGVMLSNVATAHAAGRARRGYPMVDRVVTITGPAARRPGNYRIRFGTPIAKALEASGNDGANLALRIGGPLNGYPISNPHTPITATCNCLILTEPERETAAAGTAHEAPCIRCSACSDHCPEALFPQELMRFADAGDGQGAADIGLDRCIECGVCDLVCPSSIRLTARFRHARSELRLERERREEARLAEARMQARNTRLAEREAARLARREAAWRARHEAAGTEGDKADGHARVAAGQPARNSDVPLNGSAGNARAVEDQGLNREPGLRRQRRRRRKPNPRRRNP